MENTLFVAVKTADGVLVHVPHDVISLFPLLEDRVRNVAVDVMATLDLDLEEIPPMQVNAMNIEEVPLRNAVRFAELFHASQTGGEVERSILSDTGKAKDIVSVLKKLRAGRLFKRVIQFYMENGYPIDVIHELRQYA